MRRTAEDTAVTREALLEAALFEFAERGVTATRLTEVAQRAGVTRGALYHHFTDKTGLCSATVAHFWEPLTAPVWSTLDAGLPTFLTTWLTRLRDDARFRSLLTITINAVPRAATTESTTLRDWHTRLTAAVTEQAARLGRPPIPGRQALPFGHPTFRNRQARHFGRTALPRNQATQSENTTSPAEPATSPRRTGSSAEQEARPGHTASPSGQRSNTERTGFPGEEAAAQTEPDPAGGAAPEQAAANILAWMCGTALLAATDPTLLPTSAPLLTGEINSSLESTVTELDQAAVPAAAPSAPENRPDE
ncbi:MAG TPA: TetR family transcriptional regulator [Actinoplanes sp.]|nr:TetR family transcriptional regulator [Actinoplanes sp.]